MAKAHITTASGAKVAIEGTPEEIALLVAKFDGAAPIKAAKRVAKEEANRGTKSGPVNLLVELIDGGFFKKPKGLGAIKATLEEQGHYYPVTTLSPLVLRLVRKRQLRRIKDKKRWLYVG